MTTSPLGIDISKRKFDAGLVREAGKLRHKVFPNTPAGFSQLSAWLSKQHVERVHACLEATGAYGEALATYLREARQVVSVVNPAQVKAYAQSRLSRAKTDKADATLIAQFCSERRPNGNYYPHKDGSCKHSSAASTRSWRCGRWRPTGWRWRRPGRSVSRSPGTSRTSTKRSPGPRR